jgi:LacI family transcriptional regulator
VVRSSLRIGLVFSHSLAYCRGILRGIRQYAEAEPHWVFMPVAPDLRSIQALRPLKPDGVIAHIFSDELAKALGRLGVPVVNVSSVLPDLTIPRVGVDDHACGCLAADHFLERGLRHFAFAGHRDHAYSLRRETGFRQTIESKGLRVDCYYERRQRPFDPMGRLWALDKRIQRWIRALPKPVGIFAPNDLWGVQLTEVCHHTGLQVPEEVAIVGVDNDDLLCGLSRPPLSSVALPGGRVGYEAAALLDRLLAGARAEPEPLLLPPVGVVTRRSTEILAVADHEVATVLGFIRKQRQRQIRVKDILQEVQLSRRSLERRFRTVVGRSLLDEIRRVHVERARNLLAETDLPMHVVAERSGFADGRRFSTVIREVTGFTPTAYRRQFRSGGSDITAPTGV